MSQQSNHHPETLDPGDDFDPATVLEDAWFDGYTTALEGRPVAESLARWAGYAAHESVTNRIKAGFDCGRADAEAFAADKAAGADLPVPADDSIPW